MKKGIKIENIGDCAKYNMFLIRKSMEEGKAFHATPHCDEDGQWKYDLLNNGKVSDKDLETTLKNEAYGNDDNDDIRSKRY
jgi:hypothetical protein